jgi:CheY-like chemotaxis protein
MNNSVKPFQLMIVEDNEDDFMLINDAISRDGIACAITWYKNGEEAWNALQTPTNDLPQLIISDLDMPGMGGHGLLEQIRRDARLRIVPVMIMTGSEAPDDRDFCATADHYFIKPKTRFDWGLVTSMLKRYVARYQQSLSPEGDKRESLTKSIPVILHIEDHQDDRTLFSMAFQRSEVQAKLQQVASVAEAERFLRANPQPALMVLDLKLSDGNGKDLLSSLRNDEHLRQIPVIILTGVDDFTSIQACRDLYVIDYVIKPSTPRQMSEFISTFRQWFNSALAQSIARLR